MVYCGKPSKGCSNCRERKIRCDEKVLGCSQCARSKKVCPGYRNQLDLMFRDESKSVQRKSKAKAQKTTARAAESPGPRDNLTPTSVTEAGLSITFQPQLSKTSNSFPTYPSGSTSVSGDPLQDHQKDDEDACENVLYQLELMRVPNNGGASTFIRSLIPTAEDLATGFFHTNYMPTNGSRGHFDFAPMLYSQSGAEPLLKSSMTAVGLAGFANTKKAPELMSKARASYVTALRLINQAIQSPTAATKDSVLLSTMLLSVFETVTGTSQKSLKAWTQHINGAAALIKLRGYSQFRTKTGVRLFLQMFSNLMISCVQRGTAMPPHILVLRREVAKYVDTSDPSWQMSESILKFIAYRSDVRNGMLATDESILRGALVIDASIKQVTSNLPELWQYRTVYTAADPDEVWNGYYHVYTDYWIAQVLNAQRTCRILVNEYVRDTLLRAFTESPPRWMDREHTNMFRQATDIECTMRDEILASVPQHTGYADIHRNSTDEQEVQGAGDCTPSFVSEIPASGTSSKSPNPDFRDSSADYVPCPIAPPIRPLGIAADVKDRLPLRAAGGYFLLWPLFLVGEMLLGTPEIKTWTIARLRHMGDKMGIMQAHTLATALAKREEIHAWDVNDKHIRFETLEQRVAKEPAKGSEAVRMAVEEEEDVPANYFEKANIAEKIWPVEGAGIDNPAIGSVWNSLEPLPQTFKPRNPINEADFAQETTKELSLNGPRALDGWFLMN